MELQPVLDAVLTLKEVLPLICTGGFAAGMLGLGAYIDHRLKVNKHNEYMTMRKQLQQTHQIEERNRVARAGSKIFSGPTHK